MKEKGVLYRPSTWQALFHKTAEMGINEVLGAGSAGPGKTTCLIHDIVDQLTVEHERCSNPKHPYHIEWGQSKGWALHLRRTRLNLEQTISICKRVFKQIDPNVEWNEARSTFTFATGFKYQFGHCKDPNDWEGYMSFEFCVAEHTPVLMADGSWKAIQDVKVGDLVATLEGARAVTKTHDSGVKPCVAVTTSFQGEIVGTQLQPTTHPVLLLSNDESPESSSVSNTRSARRARVSGLYWQDYESLLGERPESAVRRASSIDLQNGALTYCGSPLEAWQLPTYCVPVALYEPLLRSMDGSSNWPSVSGSEPGPCGALTCSRRAPEPQSADRFANRQQAAGVPLRELGHLTGICFCGSACEPTALETPTDCREHCPACTHSRGALPRDGSAGALGNVQPLADAAKRGPTSSVRDDRGGTPIGTSPGALRYPHFYTGEHRVQTEEYRRGEAEIQFSGFYQTFDLTVEGANHYITSTGLVNANTAIYYDELTAFNEEQYEQINTRLRSSDPVLSRMLRIRAMSNPLMRHEGAEQVTLRGNPHWVRDRFVKRNPNGNEIFKKKLIRADGTVEWHKWLYMPAKLSDNPDKGFVKQYELNLLSKPTHIRKALLDGDWFVTAGSFFAEYWDKALHVCEPFKCPKDGRFFRSMDWGYKNFGCIHWYFMDDDGTLFVIKEMKFKGKLAGEVAAMVEATEAALGLWDERRNESLIEGVADTQLWEMRGQHSENMGEVFRRKGVSWHRADKKSRQANAQHIIKRLSDHDERTKTPGIVFFKNCTYILETLPAIQTSVTNSEEPADGGDDHGYDSLAYGVAYASRGRAGIPAKREPKEPWEEDDEKVHTGRRGRHGYGQELC